jgi:pyruvate,water dikinase
MDDLTQLVLGVDRDNPSVSKLYTEINPAVLNLIKHVVRTCKKHGVKVSVCGEAGNDPRLVESLVEMGVDSVTCDMDSLGHVRDAVARTEKRLLLDNARGRES